MKKPRIVGIIRASGKHHGISIKSLTIITKMAFVFKSDDMPESENLAAHIYNQLANSLPKANKKNKLNKEISMIKKNFKRYIVQSKRNRLKKAIISIKY